MAATRKTTAKKTSAKKATKKSPAKKSTAKKVSSTTPPPSPSHLQLTHGAPVGTPLFAQATITPDPLKYTTPHASDTAAYNEMDALVKANKFLPLPFPVVPGVAEPVLLLQDVLGPSGANAVSSMQKAGQIVFHTAGDTGATRGPKTENEVVDKLLADFNETDPTAIPKFFYNLGDIVYSFGEHKYYYDQFYDAYRDYPAPIFAIPGNHDGIVLPPPAGTGVATDSLSAFLANFCTPSFSHAPDAVGLSRTTMIQPGVYFTLEAPYVRIIGLYSNILENPGVISSTADPTKGGTPAFPDLSDAQLSFLKAALTRVKTDKFKGAVLLAVHHPPYAFGKHSGSLAMLKEIDTICQSTGVWPHAVLSGHAHNYQRYTRAIGKRQIPFLVIGNGGHGLQKLAVGDGYRTPVSMPVFAQPEQNDSVTFENYDFMNYGYCRVLINAQQLRIEYHPASDGASTKTPDDSVTVDLATGTLTTYNPPS
ncbi:metallophosphoesterase [Granulicella sp. 5B5]|uniref:metallophosphoesterase family protein n=1 Tax=Granulicella sp. 5B5 TaxID=1617967 RepID=UPI0015F6FDDF|nr:metallophosphoesterase [Granulicella sp. 5B5]QMV19044.1 metallophosphoesterase [Granulicella sp. 5B5]